MIMPSTLLDMHNSLKDNLTSILKEEIWHCASSGDKIAEPANSRWMISIDEVLTRVDAEVHALQRHFPGAI
jgi:hypothetical protein